MARYYFISNFAECKVYVCICVYILYYYPYRAFGGQNKIVYSTRFVRRAILFKYCPGNIFLILPGLNVTNHLTENRAMPRPP